MLSWLRRHVQPSLPAGWIQIAPTLYQLRHGDEAIQVEVKRLRASKRATARAHGQGIVVCVPLRFSDASLKVALAGFEPWIVAQWAKSHAFAHPLLQPFVTESLPLFGEAMPVVWSEASRIAVSVVDGSLHVAAPRAVSAKQMGAALKQFYEAQAREVMAPILNPSRSPVTCQRHSSPNLRPMRDSSWWSRARSTPTRRTPRTTPTASGRCRQAIA